MAAILPAPSLALLPCAKSLGLSVLADFLSPDGGGHGRLLLCRVVSNVLSENGDVEGGGAVYGQAEFSGEMALTLFGNAPPIISHRWGGAAPGWRSLRRSFPPTGRRRRTRRPGRGP